MKRIHTLTVTMICTAALAASSFVSLSYGAELTGAVEREPFDSYELPGTQAGLAVLNLRKSKNGQCGDDLSWTLDDEGKLTISGTGKMWDFTGSNYSPWFGSSSDVKTVVVKSGVTSIGELAFYLCPNLQSITIPSGVKSIGSYAFSGCFSLQSITIPYSVNSIGKDAFYQCHDLKTMYYNGTETEWSYINIGTGNDFLTFESCKKNYGVKFATGVSLNKESLTLSPGKTSSLSAVLIPEDAVLKTMIWSSADPGIAKVDNNGTVTAVAEGETIVTAMSDAWGYSADCTVVVPRRMKPVNTFVGGQKVDVKAIYFSSHPEVTRFQSSSKKTASVSKKGIMKAKKPGNVTIEAMTGKKKAERKTVSSCSLTILEKPKLKFKAKYSAASDIGKVLDGYEFFTTASTKQTAADLWESSKPAVAEINPETGVITIKGKGTATITAYFGKKGEKGTLKVKAKLKVKK